jgi:hypothetical protein
MYPAYVTRSEMTAGPDGVTRTGFQALRRAEERVTRRSVLVQVLTCLPSLRGAPCVVRGLAWSMRPRPSPDRFGLSVAAPRQCVRFWPPERRLRP